MRYYFRVDSVMPVVIQLNAEFDEKSERGEQWEEPYQSYSLLAVCDSMVRRTP